MTEDEIANDIIKNMLNENKQFIREHAAIDLHHGFGTWIRNEYHLWEKKWTPKIIDGCDYAEDHPDQISHRIIEKVKSKL